MQHQRKKHTERVAPATKIRRIQNVITLPNHMEMEPQKVVIMPNPDVTDLTPIVINQPGNIVTVQPSDAIQGTDLLTQAMSELTQSLGEFRPEFQMAGGRVIQNATIVHQPNQLPQHTTIELSALGQAFGAAAQFQTQPNGQITLSGGAPGGSQILSAVQPITLAVNSDGQPQANQQVTFIPRTWATTNVSTLQNAAMIFK
jgi:hypothetical protein